MSDEVPAEVRGIWPAFWMLGTARLSMPAPRSTGISMGIRSAGSRTGSAGISTRRFTTVTPASLHGLPWVFDHDLYLLINVAVGGRPSQDPDRSTVLPQAMLIDYIRVYTA